MSIIDKLSYLINNKKAIVNNINSYTNTNNTTGYYKPFSSWGSGDSTYANVDFTEIEKQSRAFYPSTGYPELVCIRQYNNGTLDYEQMTSYLRPEVGLTITRTGTGIYTGSLTRSGGMVGKKYIIHLSGSHAGSSYNNPIYASFIYTNYTTTGTTTFTVWTADDDSRNDGAFNIMVWAL